MRPLVVFYSLTGRTRLVSQAIAEALQAELVEIEEVKPRKGGFLTYLTGGFSAVTNKGSKITPVNVDLKQHKTIFIGSPIWASRPAPAVNSFIYTTNFEGQGTIPFFTMGGGDSDKALQNITAKIENSQGRVIGSFAIKSYGFDDKEIIARAKETIKNYAD